MSTSVFSARNSASSGVKGFIMALVDLLGRTSIMSRISPLHLSRSYSNRFRPHIDFKAIVRDQEKHRLNASQRKMPDRVDEIVRLYDRFRTLTTEYQELSEERKKISREVASESIRSRSIEIKSKLAVTQEDLNKIEQDLVEASMGLPNTSHHHTPVGNPECNKIVRKFGPGYNKSYSPKDHVELGKELDILDFEAGAKVAGSQNYYLKNQGALLEMALTQFAIKKCLSHGFKLLLPPDMAYTGFVRACGFNPRSATSGLPIYTVHQEEKDEANESKSSSKRALVGTAEIPLAAYYSDQILDTRKISLPIKMVAFGHCFRPEVGHHGAESRGLYRVHQFSKVEMFAISEEGQSQALLEEIVSIQEEILRELGLTCRVLNMASEELGASAHCKYDIEAWLPFGKRWGELTSASNCTDFQSRRLAIRYKDFHSKGTKFPHTLNGTACAIPRTIQAILENFQLPDGSVEIPSVLQPFMLDGSCIIKKSS